MLGRPILGRKWKRILNIRHILSEHFELGALFPVANHHRCTVSCFNAQQAVVIGLVRSKSYIELGILQIKPCQVTLEIIVGK